MYSVLTKITLIILLDLKNTYFIFLIPKHVSFLLPYIENIARFIKILQNVNHYYFFLNCYSILYKFQILTANIFIVLI